MTFDGDTLSRFTQRRCNAIVCTAKIAKEPARGQIAPPAKGGKASLLSDNLVLAKVIKSASGTGRDMKKTRS